MNIIIHNSLELKEFRKFNSHLEELRNEKRQLIKILYKDGNDTQAKKRCKTIDKEIFEMINR